MNNPDNDTQKRTFLNDEIWSEVLTRYMKMVRVKQNFTIQNLSEEIESQFGITQTEGNLKNKFNRGNFGAQLFLMSIQAMGASSINMQEIEEIYQAVKKEKQNNV